jgi:hypothetical protein
MNGVELSEQQSDDSSQLKEVNGMFHFIHLLWSRTGSTQQKNTYTVCEEILNPTGATEIKWINNIIYIVRCQRKLVIWQFEHVTGTFTQILCYTACINDVSPHQFANRTVTSDGWSQNKQHESYDYIITGSHHSDERPVVMTNCYISRRRDPRRHSLLQKKLKYF